MADCIFCKIVNSEIPSYKIYEDKDYLAFLDLSQVTNGHTLLIPKKHYRWVWDIEKIGQYFETAQKIVANFKKVTGDDFVMSLMWGRDVHHAHLHLVPSTTGSLELVAAGWREALEARTLSPEEMTKIVQKFKLS